MGKAQYEDVTCGSLNLTAEIQRTRYDSSFLSILKAPKNLQAVIQTFLQFCDVTSIPGREIALLFFLLFALVFYRVTVMFFGLFGPSKSDPIKTFFISAAFGAIHENLTATAIRPKPLLRSHSSTVVMHCSMTSCETYNKTT